MNFSDDAFVTMLLSVALSPNREEYARPLSTQELARLEARVRESPLRRLGRLKEAGDISGLMVQLDISEEEAYRIYTLLNRGVQLSYALENCQREGIDLVTRCDADYPRRPIKRMGEAAPPVFYRMGNEALLHKPMLAIVGISGVKTSPEVRDAIEFLVRGAARLGFAVLTGGERGVSRVALNAVEQCGGTLVEVLGGGMRERATEEDVAALLAEGQAALVSLEHPDALFTVTHAIARNKLLFSLADAAFVFNTDGKRGELDAIRSRYCDWIYAWTGCPANHNLIARGAIPVSDVPRLKLDELSRHWRGGEAEQLNFFDMM